LSPAAMRPLLLFSTDYSTRRYLRGATDAAAVASSAQRHSRLRPGVGIVGGVTHARQQRWRQQLGVGDRASCADCQRHYHHHCRCHRRCPRPWSLPYSRHDPCVDAHRPLWRLQQSGGEGRSRRLRPRGRVSCRWHEVRRVHPRDHGSVTPHSLASSVPTLT
jgi:hypothetical protein